MQFFSKKNPFSGLQSGDNHHLCFLGVHLFISDKHSTLVVLLTRRQTAASDQKFRCTEKKILNLKALYIQRTRTSLNQREDC